MSEFPQLKQIVEGAILAADRPLSIDQMIQLFEREQPSRAQVREALEQIQAECEGKGYELKEVASGYRFQVRTEYSEWVGRLWEEKPPRYSRALLETLALIAYKQPITRGDIEEIRGVSVSTNIIRSLMEREWIRVVGHRDVPGRPAIYATTKTFLDYFNLSSLDELPTLSEIKDLDKLNPELELDEDLPEARTLELDDRAEGEDVEADQSEEEDDEFDLDDVTNQVNQIQDNIRNLFAEEEEDDDFEDGDDDDVATRDGDGDASIEQATDTPSVDDLASAELSAEDQGAVDPESDSGEQSADTEDEPRSDSPDVTANRDGGDVIDEEPGTGGADDMDEEATDDGNDDVGDEDEDIDQRRSW
ncbi:MAG: SMC-Scp complex subunit ScpB [Pseudomonadales bacterium]|nr:SMC-Scp complex subunit ScpB [Pseudomonadales bacterium]